jgi:hypothetical protein
MLDGVRGRDSGILVLRNGLLIGGGPYFWSTGSYIVGNGTWKGHLRTNQHTSFADRFVRPLFAGQEVTSGFSVRVFELLACLHKFPIAGVTLTLLVDLNARARGFS